MKNVELFDQLLHVQTDWLGNTGTRLASLRRTSKVLAHVQRQLDDFQVQFATSCYYFVAFWY